MIQPWAEAGYECYAFNADSGDHGAYDMRVEHPNIHYVDSWIEPGFDPAGRPAVRDGRIWKIPEPGIIFAFPPCTLMAHSGAKHQRAEDDVSEAVALAKVAMALGEKYDCPWMVENPVGKLSTLWRKPDAYFNPHEYGGFLLESEGSFHPKMPVCDGYTKKTCLWFGNGFEMPARNPGPVNIGKFWGWAFLGGKSAKTKQLRSLTPRGFARAVFAANHFQCGCTGECACDDCIPF